MDSGRSMPPPPPIGLAVLSKTFTKLLRLRRPASSTTAASSDLFPCIKETEALLANLFAAVSAVKAAYAQLQLAQTPYDPDSIQLADGAVVAELKRLSSLKQSFFSSQSSIRAEPELAAQLQEQRNLLATYKITASKLESEARFRESEALSLQAELRLAEKRVRAAEARLRPGRTLAGLDELHLSGLKSTHFLTLLRSAAKSVRSFVRIMTHEMESAGWDLDAAASAIQPTFFSRRNPKNRCLVFESFVSRVIFSDFQSPEYGLGGPARDRQRFFAEFNELKFLKPRECFGKKPQFAKFCWAKYSRLVHPKMESSFYGDLRQRESLSSGEGLPETDFFEGFAEMARKVWLLHSLFFSFEDGEKVGIFDVKRGSRFSEVFMESVAADELTGGGVPAVGFTVMPGFRVGKTVIQCRVYLTAGNT